MYKSKLHLLIKMEEKKINEQKERIAELTNQKNELLEDLEREEGEGKFSFVHSKLGKTLPSSFFNVSSDHFRLERIKSKIKQIEKNIEETMFIYMNLKKKKERLEEENKKREKEYYDELNKKELQKLEDLFVIKKTKK